MLLYDLTSTYFESEAAHPDKRRFGYSRDKRPDCVQVVIALIVTPEGFPLAYEVMPGNTADQTTLAGFLEKIERQYGRSERVWIMDRGIPTEETLALMREGDAPVRYLVGTPKGRLTRLEKAFLELPWQEVRQSVDVKLLAEDGELYVLVRSEGRRLKERGMRRRRPLTRHGASHIYDRAKEKAGIDKPGGIHTLRHCYATGLLEAGVELHVIQRRLGHSSIRSTMRYLHLAHDKTTATPSPLDLLDFPRPAQA